MKDISLRALDLNLLRVLDALFHERSTTRAGERLGLTQSAISHALARLRDLLGDDLFIRGPDGMLPTPRAAEIGPRLREGLRNIQLALARSEFLPAETTRRFVLACNSYSADVLLPALAARFRREAPHAELRVRPSTLGVAEDLDAGRVDIALASFRRVPERFGYETVIRDTLVWAISADHPYAGEKLTLERLSELQHLVRGVADDDLHLASGVVVEHGLERRVMQDDGGALQAALERIGRVHRVRMTVPDSRTALALVGRTDLAALVPRRLAEGMAERHRLKLLDPPYESPPADVTGVWHRTHGAQPAVMWFLDLVRGAAAEL